MRKQELPSLLSHKFLRHSDGKNKTKQKQISGRPRPAGWFEPILNLFLESLFKGENSTKMNFCLKSILWIHVMSCVCPASWPSCVAKTIMSDIIGKLFNQTFHTCHAYRNCWLLLLYTTFTDLDLAWGSQGQCKVKPIGFILSHTFHLIRMKFDVAMKQF